MFRRQEGDEKWICVLGVTKKEEIVGDGIWTWFWDDLSLENFIYIEQEENGWARALF